jgi:hypothetical protein
MDMVRIRPRLSLHAGMDASAIKGGGGRAEGGEGVSTSSSIFYDMHVNRQIYLTNGWSELDSSLRIMNY